MYLLPYKPAKKPAWNTKKTNWPETRSLLTASIEDMCYRRNHPQYEVLSIWKCPLTGIIYNVNIQLPTHSGSY